MSSKHEFIGSNPIGCLALNKKLTNLIHRFDDTSGLFFFVYFVFLALTRSTSPSNKFYQV
jgi:hypothetical protein